MKKSCLILVMCLALFTIPAQTAFGADNVDISGYPDNARMYIGYAITDTVPDTVNSSWKTDPADDAATGGAPGTINSAPEEDAGGAPAATNSAPEEDAGGAPAATNSAPEEDAGGAPAATNDAPEEDAGGAPAATNAAPEETAKGDTDHGWSILGYEEDSYDQGYGTGLIEEEWLYPDPEDGTVTFQFAAGEDAPAMIDAVFGFITHNSGSIYLGEGTVVNSKEASCLYKSGDLTWTVNGAVLHPENGIILQMIDNDDPAAEVSDPSDLHDSTTNVSDPSDLHDPTADVSDPSDLHDPTADVSDPTDLHFQEQPGFPNEAYTGTISYVYTDDEQVNPSKTYYEVDFEAKGGYFTEVENPTARKLSDYFERATRGDQVILQLENGDYQGNIFNSTGYYMQAPDALTVSIAPDAALTGDIALTSHLHGIRTAGRRTDDIIASIQKSNPEEIEYVFLNEMGEVVEDPDAAAAIQFTRFSLEESCLPGHVLNLINYNGLSSIDVYVEGTWNVADTSLVTYLNIAEGAQVYGRVFALDDKSLLLIPSSTALEPGIYGREYIEAEAPPLDLYYVHFSEDEMAEGEASADGTYEDPDAETVPTEKQRNWEVPSE